MLTGKTVASFLMSCACLLMSACDSSSSSSNSNTSACPLWQIGDAMTYQTTETVNGVPTTTSATWTVTAHTATSVTMSDGTLGAVYGIQGDSYIPESEDVIYTNGITKYTSTDTYISTTPFCPSPSVGDTYQYSTFVLNPDGRTGSYYSASLSVSNMVEESIQVGSESYSVVKLTLAKIGGRADSTVTRYFANGIGVVKEVEDIPATNTTITKELITYSYQ